MGNINQIPLGERIAELLSDHAEQLSVHAEHNADGTTTYTLEENISHGEYGTDIEEAYCESALWELVPELTRDDSDCDARFIAVYTLDADGFLVEVA